MFPHCGLLLLSTCLFLSCSVSPAAQHTKAVNREALYLDAFDEDSAITPSSLQCLRDGYKTAFVTVYDAAGYNGKVLGNGVSDIQLATAIGLHVEVVMLPRANLKKTGAQQLEEMYSSLLDANITVKSVWIMIYGLTVGIYTSRNDWSNIFGNTTVNNLFLWYYISEGNTGEALPSPPDFNDFVPFAGWTYPTVKQYATYDRSCGFQMNRDIYSTSSAAVADVAISGKSDHIVVGGLGLGNAAFAGKAELWQ